MSGSSIMRTGLVAAGLLLALGVPGWIAFDRQQVVEHGRTVLVPLAPVDPRSLFQGDYMALNFADAALPPSDGPLRGKAVVELDDKGVAIYRRLDDGTALGPTEQRVAFHPGAWGPIYAADSYFFEEGTADSFVGARFAVLKVREDGLAVLVALADAEGQPIAARNPVSP